MHQLARQLFWFILVGCAAALTHWGVAVATVELTGIAPALANIVGWLIAFFVSFCGHYHLTFRHAGAGWRHAALRFFLVSAAGFAINESAYVWLLRVTPLPYDVLLAIVLVSVAAGTFIAGRFWAFRHKPAP